MFARRQVWAHRRLRYCANIPPLKILHDEPSPMRPIVLILKGESAAMASRKRYNARSKLVVMAVHVCLPTPYINIPCSISVMSNSRRVFITFACTALDVSTTDMKIQGKPVYVTEHNMRPLIDVPTCVLFTPS